MKDELQANFICFALLCARYSFFYDVAIIVAKQFRLSDQVFRNNVNTAMGTTYGYNVPVRKTIDRFFFFCEEAGILSKPKMSVYEVKQVLEPKNDIVKKLWEETYFINDTFADREDTLELPFEPFFRYLKLLPDVNI